MDSSSMYQGTWKLTAINLSTPLDLDGDNIADTNLVDKMPIIDGTIIFDSASTGSYNYNSNVSFNTRYDNGKLMFLVASSIPPGDQSVSFIHSESSDQITINDDITFNKVGLINSVLTVDGNTLKMNVSNGFEVTDIETLDIVISQDVEYVFSKN